MAMKPFGGYHFGDYWQHWLEVGKRLQRPPAIFQVNWFRRDEDGGFIWPGFGENLRVLEWIVARCGGEGDVQETPVGNLPEPGAIDLNGLEQQPDMETLLAFDGDGWRQELTEMAGFFKEFEPRVPAELHRQLAKASAALG
jgi:phosphoenolpyruvate carboxykinase (GTP)